jgi:carboxymethylenebutenolidase
MGEIVELTADDGHTLFAYIAGPPDAVSSVVVIQEIFGVNSHIRSVVDLYADLGYLAIAPAMFDRAERGVDLEYTEEGRAAGFAVSEQIDWLLTPKDIGAAVEHVRRDRPVGVIGYCWGGGASWLAANELRLDAAVSYYGGQIKMFLDRGPQCPMLLHFGETDHAIPPEDVLLIHETYPEIPLYVYEDAGHGFNCDIRASYNAQASAVALARTKAFFSEHLKW